MYRLSNQMETESMQLLVWTGLNMIDDLYTGITALENIQHYVTWYVLCGNIQYYQPADQW